MKDKDGYEMSRFASNPEIYLKSNKAEREVATDVVRGIVIDTCSVLGNPLLPNIKHVHPYETAICSPHYRGGHYIVVEEYDSVEAAVIGHARWIEIVKGWDPLPNFIKHISTSSDATEIDQKVGSDKWRICWRQDD